MKPTPAPAHRTASGSFASALLLVGLSVAGLAACSAEGQIGDSPTSGTGSPGSTGASTGSGSGTGSTGAGGAQVVDPTNPSSPDWYETMKGADCSVAPAALPPTRIWRLSASQWKNTVAKALGIAAPDVGAFPRDAIDPLTGFSDDSTGNKITLALATAYFDASDAAATAAAASAVGAMQCLGTAPIAVACGQTFAAAYGARLFRRALTTAETTTYATYLNGESNLDPPATAVASTLKAMLLSPNFLYRTELGSSRPGTVELTAEEIASLLSYSIADVPPDDQLLAAAAQGKLAEPATRLTEAERLAALPGARDKLATFWREYLALGDPPTTTGIEASMYNEATTFFAKAALDNPGSLRDLLTAPYTYADETVASVYGTAKPAADGRLALDPKQRSGILTSASMLAHTAAPSQGATVIHRGLLVRGRLLCQTPPPPPADFVPNPTQVQQAGDDATAKENYDFFAKANPGCNACHSNFHPLGLPFESYDALGKFRAAYPSGKPIVTSGTLIGAGDASGDFTDVVGLAARLGGSEIAQYCFAQQYASYALGRPVRPDQEPCTVRDMGSYVIKKGGQVRGLLASFANAPNVFRRVHQ